MHLACEDWTVVSPLWVINDHEPLLIKPYCLYTGQPRRENWVERVTLDADPCIQAEQDGS